MENQILATADWLNLLTNQTRRTNVEGVQHPCPCPHFQVDFGSAQPASMVAETFNY